MNEDSWERNEPLDDADWDVDDGAGTPSSAYSGAAV
jgi:hypothetical protein